MKSSGIRRGLAVAAVSAIAVMGTPFAAHANDMDDQPAADSITLLTGIFTPNDSVKDDHTDTTVTLEAAASATYSTVTFQYQPAGSATWTTIDTVSRNDNGAFKIDWAVPASALAGVNIGVRVIGDSTLGTHFVTPTRMLTIKASSDPNAEAIAVTPLDELGYFDPPQNPVVEAMIGVTGTTSAPSPRPVWTGMVRGDGSAFLIKNGTAQSNGTFNASAFDIAGLYRFDTTAPINDELAISAAVEGPGGLFVDGSSDVETVNLYSQVISDIKASPTGGNVLAGQKKTVTITVLDQKGKPIAGAEVRSSTPGSPTKTTNNKGQAVFDGADQQGAGTVTYWTNATNQLEYDAAQGDKKVDVTFTVGAASDLKLGTNRDGKAFDEDEFAPGDITVQAVDGAGSAIDVLPAQQLQYRWKVVPFNGAAARITKWSTPTDDNPDGSGNYPVQPLPTYRDDPDHPVSGTDAPVAAFDTEGTWTLEAQLNGAPSGAIAAKTIDSFKIGDANLTFEGSDPQWADVNGSATVTGALKLDDGTALPGRRIDVTFVRGGEGDDPVADAIIEGGPVVAKTTDASGKFTVTVKDIPDGPELSELGGQVHAVTVLTPNIGNAGASGDHGVDFVTSAVPADAKIDLTDVTGAAPCNALPTTVIGKTPGKVQCGDVLLTDQFNDPLKGRKVTLHLDRGMFVDSPSYAKGKFDPAPAAGANFGERKSLTDTVTVATDNAGHAKFWVSIEGDNGFNDDGKVKATVTGTAGPASDTQSYDWDTINGDSDDTLNIGQAKIELTPGQDLPARAGDHDAFNGFNAGEPVRFDVFAKDQFGNFVKNVVVNVGCAVVLGDDDPCPTVASPSGVVGNGFESDFDNGGDFVVKSDFAGTFNFSAKVPNYPSIVWNSTATADTVNSKDIATNDFSAEWYDIDFAASTYTMDPADGATTDVKVGVPITVTVNVKDQKGKAVSGLWVNFVRTSNALNDQDIQTDSTGTAQYVFKGNQDQCNTDDVVTAVVRNGFGGPIVKQMTTTIHYTCDDVKTPIQVAMTGKSSFNKNGKPIDVLKITATTVGSTLPVTGAPVHLMAKIDGVWTEIGKGDRVLDSSGKVTFYTKDRTPNGGTKYQAVVDEADTTAAGESQVFKQR